MFHPKNRSGYTLVEQLAVLMIAASLIALAAPGLRDYFSLTRLEMTARVLATTMMKVRYQAVFTTSRCRLHFNIPEGSYYYTEDLNQNYILDRDEKTSPKIYLPAGVRFDATGILGPPSKPTNPPASPVTFTGGVMSVGAEGAWSNPGTVYLGDGSDHHVAVTVAIAGRVRVWVWNRDTAKWQ